MQNHNLIELKKIERMEADSKARREQEKVLLDLNGETLRHKEIRGRLSIINTEINALTMATSYVPNREEILLADSIFRKMFGI